MPKKSEYITKSHFDDVIESLWTKMFSVFATHEDFEALNIRMERLEAKFDAGFSNLDAYMKRSETWHDEHVLLRASHQRLKDVLVKKGVVSDSELAV